MEPFFITAYKEKIEKYASDLERYASELIRLSIGRLFFFGLFVWLLITGFQNGFDNTSIGMGLLFLFVFFVLVMFAYNLKKKQKFVRSLLKINQNEVAVYKGGTSFLDDGSAITSPHGFTTDLNVFGTRSLFHVLNRAGSLSGKQQLSRHLSSPFVLPEQIIQYQACTKELYGKLDFRQQLLAQCLSIEDESGLAQLLKGIDRQEFRVLQTPLVRVLAIAWPLVGIGAVSYSIWSGHYQWMLLVLLLGLIIAGIFLRKTNALYNHISRRSYLYTQYAECFRLISKENFSHDYLDQKRRSVAYAQQAFKKLSGIITWFDLRLNFLLAPFVNGLFLSDLLCAKKYLVWDDAYQRHVQNWFDTLGEMELLNSLAAFHFNHPGFVFPVPVIESPGIYATNVGHPLMSEEKAVLNDIAIGETSALHLVTGSNMSGKSTYLRTVGLNIVLAQTGAPVFADEFRFTPLRLLTSFHHIDSLEESTSYFYAELKSLKHIIQSLDHPVPALVLLDEVMRGTNSKDKHDGTALLIKKLLEHNCLTMIATHDTDLGTLENLYPGKIENYCFESEITEDGLQFDFKRRNGVAQTKNATYLMKQMGII